MSYLKHRKSNLIRVELAPLIDVVFILLIFFAVTSSLMVKNQGMFLQLPKIDTVNTNKVDFTLSINKQSELFFNQKKISLSDLRPLVKRIIKKSDSSQLIIEADELSSFGFVVEIMDLIRKAGCYDIVLAADKK